MTNKIVEDLSRVELKEARGLLAELSGSFSAIEYIAGLKSTDGLLEIARGRRAKIDAFLKRPIPYESTREAGAAEKAARHINR